MKPRESGVARSTRLKLCNMQMQNAWNPRKQPFSAPHCSSYTPNGKFRLVYHCGVGHKFPIIPDCAGRRKSPPFAMPAGQPEAPAASPKRRHKI